MNNQNTGFVSGTLVHTISGLKPIQALKVGDIVLSRSEHGETIRQPIQHIKKTAQAIFRCTLLEEQTEQNYTVHYLFSAGEQQIYGDSDWVSVARSDNAIRSAYNLSQQDLNLWRPKPVFAASNRKQQTFGLNAATFRADSQLNGKDDEFIHISPNGLIYHQPDEANFNFAPATAPLHSKSVNWNSINKKTLVLPVYQLCLADADNYFVGDEGILARSQSVYAS